MNFKKIFNLSTGIIMGGLVLTSCAGEQQKQAAPAPELAVITVGEKDATLQSMYPATLHGKNDVEIRPQISGFLTNVHVSEGQRVSKGQRLFTIDQVQLQAAVDAAKAQVEVAQANVNTAQTNADNNKLLFDKNIISASAYQTSVDALNAAKAQLNAAKAQLTSAQKNLSYSVVSAPAAGIVGSITFKEGALVSPSTLLTILSNNSEIEAYFSMNEKEVLAMTANGGRSFQQALDSLPEVTLRLANGEDYALKGKVISLSGVIDPATGSATAKASFKNPDGIIRSGSTGQILIPNVSSDVIEIPQKATYEIQNLKFCYVVGDSSKVQSRAIEVADQHDGKNFIITKGLKSGDVVVVEGVGISVKEGMVIKPKHNNQAEAK
ncbi:MAG: efflux RND transporter periplasmic adaptor subunit [Muribaculaceae bacterium]|nr:efflux RND transporter periplasmic adaptor subunit [Muribaculaceae bacterium]